MSKAFDKVWHEGRLCKLKIYGIDGKLPLQEKVHRGVVLSQVFHMALYWDLYYF